VDATVDATVVGTWLDRDWAYLSVRVPEDGATKGDLDTEYIGRLPLAEYLALPEEDRAAALLRTVVEERQRSLALKQVPQATPPPPGLGETVQV
jgi:hypothetical protein